MPSASEESSTPSGSTRSKPSTRSSIRQSLNLSLVGKAFADVISKDGRDAAKTAKKAKETASRRLSAANPTPRASMDGVRAPMHAPKRVATPDSKTVTARRRASVSMQKEKDEQPSSSAYATPSAQPTATGPLPRSSTLRPRNLNGATASALPKYRPKSVTMDNPPKAPPSPVRAGTRRRLSSSDDDTSEEKKEQRKPTPSRATPVEKGSRPISPLPQRAANKANRGTPIPTTPTKAKSSATPSSNRASPTRPTKTVKTTAASSASQSVIPRPSSSASTSSSLTPHTPKSTSSKAIGLRRTVQEKVKQTGTPTSASKVFLRESPSPAPRHVRNGSKTQIQESPSIPMPAAGNLSHVSEGDGEDSEAEDVELLLAPVAALGAPTPAMPRIQTRKRLIPQTPTRNFLPARANLSYVSPLPPDSDGKSDSPPFLRPPATPGSGHGKPARGSILSWEQLASEASRTLGEDEIEHMLSDIPAPFRPGAISPSLSVSNDVPESPCLSAIDSPGGYGSISQVLLPDVTPSPAVGRYSLSPPDPHPRSAISSEAAASTITLLRLQLASAENTAKERLFQIQAMEEEIHNLKEAHVQQVQEAARQLVYLEEAQVNRAGADRKTFEEQQRAMMAAREQAEADVRESERRAREAEAEVRRLRTKGEVVCLAKVAASNWTSVYEVSEVELDLVRGDRAVLSVLLGELDRMSRLLA